MLEVDVIRDGWESVKRNLKIVCQFTTCSKVDKIYGKVLSICVVAGLHGCLQFSIKVLEP